MPTKIEFVAYETAHGAYTVYRVENGIPKQIAHLSRRNVEQYYAHRDVRFVAYYRG